MPLLDPYFSTERYAILAAQQIRELQSERKRLRKALRPFVGAEDKVWKGTEYGDACRRARDVYEGEGS